MSKIKVDIVGGGLAGLSTAISLRNINKNIEVTVYEKHKKIGYNVEGRRCGEGHTVEAEWVKWKPSKKSYFNKADTVLTYLGDKTYTAKGRPDVGYILNRQEFIYQLGLQAKKLGAKIVTNNKIKSAENLSGDIIVDASGCPSTIKRDLGIDKGLRGLSYQQTLENSNCFISNTLKVFFTKFLGYYWIFPRNPDKKEVNVGIGVLHSSIKYNLKELLEKFKKEQGIKGEVNYVTGGMIPGGLQRPLRYKNILFVGDAGVGAHPILGKGIYRALYSGDLAANCIAKGHFERYPKVITREFIKWDIIGKSYIRIGQTLSNISDDALLFFHKKYLDFWYSTVYKNL